MLLGRNCLISGLDSNELFQQVGMQVQFIKRKIDLRVKFFYHILRVSRSKCQQKNTSRYNICILCVLYLSIFTITYKITINRQQQLQVRLPPHICHILTYIGLWRIISSHLHQISLLQGFLYFFCSSPLSPGEASSSNRFLKASDLFVSQLSFFFDIRLLWRVTG